MRLALPALVTLVLSCASSTPAPQSTGAPAVDPAAECSRNPHLPRLRELMAELLYDEATTLVQRAIEFPNNCKDDLAEIYRIKAELDAIAG